MNTKTEEEFNTILGRQLMILRMKERMSLDQLGAHLGVTGQQITKYETGVSRMPPEKISRCCHIFSVTADHFFGEIASSTPFDKSIITVAAEINDLPLDLRKAVYNLGRLMNQYLEHADVANNQNINKLEKVAQL